MSNERINVLVDGQPRTMTQGTTLAALVAECGHEPNAVTTAVNGEFVPRGRREQQVLQGGDAVLLFRPIVGG